MANQIVVAFSGEGSSDNTFFEQLLNRAIPQMLIDEGIDATLQPIVIFEKKEFIGKSFIESMEHIQQTAPRVNFYFIHMDADDRTEDTVVENKWAPWIDRASEPSRWVAVIPVQMTEAWMLSDIDALSNLFLVETDEIYRILNGRQVENIADPKSVFREINSCSDYETEYHDALEILGKRINIDRLKAFVSFRSFADRFIIATRANRL